MKKNYERNDWDVKHLLMDWKLECIWPHLLAQKIDGAVLQMIKLHHIRMLLGAFPLGIQIRFEYHLEQWRCSIGRPLNGQTYDEISDFVTQQSFTPQKIYRETLRTKPTPPERPPPMPKQEISKPISAKDTSNSSEDPLLVESGRISPDTPSIRSKASTSSFSKNNTPMPYTSKPNGPVPNVKLHEILMNCRPEGPQLIQTYRLNKCFSQKDRRRLVDMLAHYYLRNDLDFGLQTSYALERAILKMFPSERLNMYRRAKRGSIYCKYSSAKLSYKKQRQGSDNHRRRHHEANDEMFDFDDMEVAGISDYISKDESCENMEEHSDNEDSNGTVLNEPGEIDEAKLQYSYSYLVDGDTHNSKPTVVEHTEYA